MIVCEIHIYRADPIIVVTKESAKGAYVWGEMLKQVPIAYPRSFGLQYTNHDNEKCWLDLSLSVGKQLTGCTCDDSVAMQLRVKFWPPEPSLVSDELSRCLLVVELYEHVQTGSWTCSKESLAQLGGLTLQSQFGNYSMARHQPGYSRRFCLSIYQTPDVEYEMEMFHRSDKCFGLTPTQCDKLILDLCKRLPLYGVHKYSVKDSDDHIIILGLCCQGLLVLAGQSVVHKFLWTSVKNSFVKKQVFYVELLTQDQPQHSTQIGFLFDHKQEAKRFLHLFVEFQAYYNWALSMNDESKSAYLPLSQSRSRNQFSTRPYSEMVESKDMQRPARFSLPSQVDQPLELGSLRRRAVCDDSQYCLSVNSPLMRRLQTSDSSSVESVLTAMQHSSQLTSTESVQRISGRHGNEQQKLHRPLSEEFLSSCDEVEDEGYSGDVGFTPDAIDIPDVDIQQIMDKMSASLQKAWHGFYFVACELRDTERSYCSDLELLNVHFRSLVVKSQLLSARQVSELFGNLDVIQEFHKDFLRELENRLDTWENQAVGCCNCVVGDIVKKRMACMKMYTNYVTNESKIYELLSHWQQKNSDFARVCSQFEELDLTRRPASELFYRPFQRMVHYKELLKRLLDNCDIEGEDFSDIEEALEGIEIALGHVNKSTQSAEDSRKMIRLQRELEGIENLLKPGRSLIKEGTLYRIGGRRPQPYVFFVFTDILVYAVKKSKISGSYLIARGVLPLVDISVEDELNDLIPSFRLIGKQQLFTLAAETVREKYMWIKDLERAAKIAQEKNEESKPTNTQEIISGLPLPFTTDIEGGEGVNPEMKKLLRSRKCFICKRKFHLLRRKHVCKNCGKMVCGQCLTSYVCGSRSAELQLVCDSCYRLIQNKVTASQIRCQNIVDNELESCSSLDTSYLDRPRLPTTSGSVDAAVLPPASQEKSLLPGLEEMEDMFCKTYSSNTTSAVVSHPDLGDERKMGVRLLSLPKSMSYRHRAAKHVHDDNISWPQTTKPNQKKSVEHRKALLSLKNGSFARDREMSGYLLTKVKNEGGWKRFWVVISGCCLNLCRSHNDCKTLSCLLLPQCELSLPNKTDLDVLGYTFVFKLTCGQRVLYYMANSKFVLDRWTELMCGIVSRSFVYRHLSRLAVHSSPEVSKRCYTVS